MKTLDWPFDGQGRLGGRAVERAGDPLLIDSEHGPAVLFDGVDDALFLADSPLEGLSEYTIEVLFRPDAGGKEEQRFVHAGTVDGDRLLFETRPAGAGGWCLDAFLQSGDASAALLDRTRAHPLGRWHWVAAVAGSGRFGAFVDGAPELSRSLPVAPAPPGGLSLGCRRNRVSWFRGAIARVRITPAALAPRDLLRVP